MWAHLLRAFRLILVLVVGLLVVFLSGLSGRPLGWLWAALVLGAGAGAASWLLWSGEGGQRAVVAVAVCFAAVVGAAVGEASPAGPVVLGRALEEVELPESAELVEASSAGDALCFDVCTMVERRYVVTAADRREVVEDVRAALGAAGYELLDDSDAFAFAALSERRGVQISGRVDPRPQGRGVVLDLTARAG